MKKKWLGMNEVAVKTAEEILGKKKTESRMIKNEKAT